MSADPASAVRALAASGAAGALLQIAARDASLAALRTAGRTRDELDALLETAWTRVAGRLPVGTVARRVGWSAFDAVLAGERPAVVALARGLLGSLVADRALAALSWQLVLVRISDDPDRALLCDSAYDVAAASGDVIAWVEPYAGDDWRTAGRYPTVDFEPTLARRAP